MAHPEQNEFVSLVKQYFPEFFSDKKVLEIGSLDLNGGVRAFFADNCSYTGADLEIGPGVDIAVPGQLISFPSVSFDVTISCECFEHNPYWLETFINMLRMTKPGGLVIVTVASYGRPEHGTSASTPKSSPFTVNQGWEYYCNLSSYDFFKKIDLLNWFSQFKFYYNYLSKDIYFIGITKNNEDIAPSLQKDYAERLNIIQKYYHQNFRNQLYEKMCGLDRKLFEGLRLYWLLRPIYQISHKFYRVSHKLP